jgi:hypothetical protein
VLGWLQIIRAIVALAAGRYDEAYALVARVFDPRDPSHHISDQFLGVTFLADAAVGCGRVEHARAIIGERKRLAGEDHGARLCAEAMGTEAVHRALVRHAQNELGTPVGVPNDVGFENFDWRSVDAVREALEGLGIGYGVQTDRPGRFYEYPGDPLASGVGTPVSHTTPA